jgi:hypothetical protein
VPRSPGRARGGGSSTATAVRTGAAVERVRNSGAGALRRSWVRGGGGRAGETTPGCCAIERDGRARWCAEGAGGSFYGCRGDMAAGDLADGTGWGTVR